MDYFDELIRLSALVLPVLAVLLALWLIGYYLVYRKCLHGSRKIPFLSAVKGVALLVYIGTVLEITVLRRGVCITAEGLRWMGEGPMQINLQPFFDFLRPEIVRPERAALLAVLNVVLFLPLGILLPVVFPKFRKFGWMLAAGIGFSLLIETVQLVGRVGIFETDDLLFNTVGAVIGFLLYKLFVLLSGKKEAR